VVDLDGARAGAPEHLDQLRAMAGHLDVPIQYGGGLRTLESVRDALAAGATRVVLGTAALRDERLLDAALAEAGADRVVVAVDARGGRVSVAGWTEASEILPEELELGTVAVLVLGSASIIYGALQAISRRNTDEVLAYSTIGQAGYILLALGVGGTIGFSAAVIYAVVNSLNKTLLFLAASLRGPLVGAAFAVGAFSVVGVPPAVGYIGKIAAFKAGLAAGGTVQVVALLAVIFAGSALSFIYMFQLYQRVFLADKPGDPWQSKNTSSRRPRVLVVLLAALVLAMGLWPEPLLVVSEQAATALTGSPGGGSP